MRYRRAVPVPTVAAGARSSAGVAARKALEAYRDGGALWAASLVADRIVPGGVLRLWRDVRITPDALRAQVAAILAAWGMGAEAAAITNEHLLYADLHGIDSHGCAMLLTYQRDLAAGLWRPDAAVATVHEHDTTALLDGGGGLGHVPADAAMRLAIVKCRTHGVGVVAVRNSGHFGAAGSYAALATREGLIGLATTSTRVPSVVPTFGVDARLGTNPIAFAAPAASEPPFLLDMATSTAPLGRLGVAAHRGRSIPRGWALDARGAPETSARRAIDARRLTPLGGSREQGSHKGYGLAAMVEILSAVLPGTRRATAEPGSIPRVGHFFLALDPARFRGDGGFATDLDALVASLRDTRAIDPTSRVQVAGDPERDAAIERTRDGIPLPRAVLEGIRHVARASGAPFLLAPGTSG